MVVLVGGDHEEGVVLVDPVCREAVEECAERMVIGLEGGNVARLAGAIGPAHVWLSCASEI